MSDMYLKDGTGSGTSAGVTEDHRLLTESISKIALEYFSDESGLAFTSVYRHECQVTDTSEGVCFIKNNSGSDHIHVSHIVFTTQSGTVYCEIYVDATLTSGGGARPFVNLNRASANVLDDNFTTLDGKLNNLVLGTDTDLEVACVVVRDENPTFDFQANSALIISPGKSLAITAKQLGGTGAQIRATIYGYLEDVAN